jgi:hypothetical protein
MSSIDRQDFLVKNKPLLIAALKEARGQIEDPFGVVLDLRGHHGRQFALALGKTDKEIDDCVRYYERERQIPTLVAVISWHDARVLLPHTSPTATASLDRVWKACQACRQIGAVAVGVDGNTYSMVSLD